jgi:hypothetical protein
MSIPDRTSSTNQHSPFTGEGAAHNESPWQKLQGRPWDASSKLSTHAIDLLSSHANSPWEQRSLLLFGYAQDRYQQKGDESIYKVGRWLNDVVHPIEELHSQFELQRMKPYASPSAEAPDRRTIYSVRDKALINGLETRSSAVAAERFALWRSTAAAVKFTDLAETAAWAIFSAIPETRLGMLAAQAAFKSAPTWSAAMRAAMKPAIPAAKGLFNAGVAASPFLDIPNFSNLHYTFPSGFSELSPV